MIDSKFDSMGDEYNKLIKDFNDGNFESYQKSLETTSEKINQISKDLEKIINDKIKIFQEELIKELDFIIKELKKLYINNQSNLNDKKIFDSANQTEQAVLSLIFAPIFGIGYLGFLAGGAFLAAIPTSPLLIGALVYHSQALISGLCTGLAWTGVVGVSLVGLAGLIHGGFCLYKKITEKKKYIELVENAKKELMASCPNYKDKINSILEEIKKQIEKAVVKFEEILYSKKEGIKNNKEE